MASEEEEGRLPVIHLTPPLDIVVEMKGVAKPGVLRCRRPSGGVVSTPHAPGVGDGFLCHFYPGRASSPALCVDGKILGVAAETHDAETPTGYVVRWTWAFCPKGEEQLRKLLMTQLGFPKGRFRGQDFVDAGDASIFAFSGQSPDRLGWFARRLLRRTLPSQDLASAPQAANDGQGLAPLSRLTTRQKVAVDVPCAFDFESQLGGAVKKGRIQYLVREGLFIQTTASLPSEREAVVVRLPVRRGNTTHPIQLRGTARPPIHCHDSPWGGGFGLAVGGVDDGHHGSLFQSFLEFLIERAERAGSRAAPAPDTWSASSGHRPGISDVAIASALPLLNLDRRAVVGR